jgi:hypothetical protein
MMLNRSLQVAQFARWALPSWRSNWAFVDSRIQSRPSRPRSASRDAGGCTGRSTSAATKLRLGGPVGYRALQGAEERQFERGEGSRMDVDRMALCRNRGLCSFRQFWRQVAFDGVRCVDLSQANRLFLQSTLWKTAMLASGSTTGEPGAFVPARWGDRGGTAESILGTGCLPSDAFVED